MITMTDQNAQPRTQAGAPSPGPNGGMRASPCVAMVAVRFLLVCWAGFWIWFCTMAGVSEGWPGLGYAGAMVGILAALTVATWRWPVVGGLVTLFVGVAGFLAYRGYAAQWLLCFPAAALGATAALVAARQHRD